MIDCGCLAGPLATTADSEVRRILAASSTTSILVTRSCFLALRRAIHGVQRPGAVVLIAEPGRTLTAADVSAVLDVETVVTVPWDSGIARAVDAGLLVTRLPSKLARALTRAA